MVSTGEMTVLSPSKSSIKRQLPSPSRVPSPKKLHIVERYSSPSPTLHHNSDSMPDERAFLSKLHPIQMDLDRIDKELSFYKRRILSQRTAISTEELHIVKLEEDVKHLSGVVSKMEEDVNQLDHFADESMKQVKMNFDMQKKEIQLNHDKKLLELKESISSEIDKAVSEAAQRQKDEKLKLLEDIDLLKQKLQLARKEKNKRLIHIKEDHSRAVFDIKSEMEDATVETQNAVLDFNLKRDQALQVLKSKIAYYEQDLAGQLAAAEHEIAEVREESSANEMSTKLINDEIKAKIANINACKSQHESYIDEINQYREKTNLLRSLFPGLESRRRYLHGLLQDLKGNIRVYCRIRPDDSAPHAHIQCTASSDIGDHGKQELVISKSENTVLWSRSNAKPENHSFLFDKIFDQTSTNDEIFEEWSQLVQSAVDGSKVCVFAYGQTGSGKTFTMSNRTNGMIPLSMAKIFAELNELQTQGWSHTVEGDFVEIYNDNIVDLLSDSRSGAQRHDIKHDDAAATTSITNLVSWQIKSPEDASSLLAKANKNRATASTNINERSSRSHSVFTIKISGQNHSTGETRNGILNLIDLAGSERLNQSHATGPRLKETQAINRSLSCLGDVIHSLSRKQSGGGAAAHVPFRNSKLTYLLKHSLQGDSKTLMFVNISPLLKNFNETVNSLRFAAKVNQTKLT